MARVEILIEEPSMEQVLRVILPKILPDYWVLDKNYFIRPHEGKSDLQKSIPKKVKVFSRYQELTGIVVVQDQDSHDCKILKSQLLELCSSNGDCPVLVRIVCRELETWYLGNMQAIQSAYPQFPIKKYQNKAKFREPDKLNAADELKKILPEFQKISSARAIAPYLIVNQANNKSLSFHNFIKGITNFFEQLQKQSNYFNDILC